MSSTKKHKKYISTRKTGIEDKIQMKRKEVFDKMKKAVMERLAKLETPEEIFNAVVSAYIMGNRVMDGNANPISVFKSMIGRGWLDITKDFTEWEPSERDLAYIINSDTEKLIKEFTEAT